MGKHSTDYKFELDRIYGKNRLWCSNKIITGEKFYNMIFTFFLFSTPYILSIIFFLKLGPLKLYKNIIYIIISSLLYIIHIYSMLKGGCTDPGILPRQNDDLYYSTSRINMRYRVGGHILKYNYCYSCYLFRPPRTSHCAVCDNCVERFDHHCLWLGTCIGKKNYKYFYTLLGSLNINAIFQIIFCAYVLFFEIKKIKNKENKGYTFIIIIGCIILYNLLFEIIFIGKLFIIHTYLIFKGLTYYEYSKEKMKLYPDNLNPFNKYKFFSKKCILFRNNEKSYLLTELNKENNNNKNNKKNEKEIKRKKNKKNKKKIYKDEKNSNQSWITKDKYLKTYQQHQSNTRKKYFGNPIFLKRDKKKYTDENNNYINSSKRTIGPLSLELRDVFNNQEKVLKNYISSSDGSKDIDFDKNANVVINPYCIILDKKKAKNNKNNNYNNNDNINVANTRRDKVVKNNDNNVLSIKRNDVRKESPLPKIMFTNIEKNNGSKKSESIKITD